MFQCAAHQLLPAIVGSPQQRTGYLLSSTMKRHWLKEVSVKGTRGSGGLTALRDRDGAAEARAFGGILLGLIDMAYAE